MKELIKMINLYGFWNVMNNREYLGKKYNHYNKK